MTRIFVGNLPYTVTSEDITALFSPHGQVDSTTLITDRATGRSKGFAFVEMPDDVQAQAAIAKLNGTDYSGRSLAVSVARPKHE